MRGLYARKCDLAIIFGMHRQTVYTRVKGIEEEIKKGRYSRYAISENLVNKAVFCDYNKYHKQLENPRLRKYVPDFDIATCQQYVRDLEDLVQESA